MITSKNNYNGRGFELSELLKFNESIFSFDDRTGIVYKLSNIHKIPTASEEFIIFEGDNININNNGDKKGI